MSINLIRKLLLFINSACGMSPNFYAKENAEFGLFGGVCKPQRHKSLLKTPY